MKNMEISNNRLYFIVFISGAIVMILEVVGSRILAPTLGTSLFVWTSLIGIILGAMSLGYYLGGRIADKKPNRTTYANIILLAGIFIFIIIIIREPILAVSSFLELREAAVFSSIVLFLMPGVLLGAVSPYSVRLAMKNIETSGNTVGNLYAISTLGSIVGTFLAGFYFIPKFGSINILYGLAIALFVLSFIACDKKKKNAQVAVLFAILFTASIAVNAKDSQEYLVDEDSEYNHIRVYDAIDSENKQVRIMSVENFFDSGMYADSDELVFEYSKYFRLADIFKTDMQRVAVFGGAAYSVPKDLLRRKQNIAVDVVEIDKRTTEIAEKYFRLNANDQRLKIHHQDARTFLNNAARDDSAKYDIVFNDAFSSTCTTPFHLTTIEAIKNVQKILNTDGLYIMNLISSIKGDKSIFFQSEYKTLKKVFKNVYVVATNSNSVEYSNENQNIVIIATNSDFDLNALKTANENNEYGKMLSNVWQENIDTSNAVVLTDDYAPVDYYTSKLCRVVNKNQ